MASSPALNLANVDVTKGAWPNQETAPTILAPRGRSTEGGRTMTDFLKGWVLATLISGLL